MEEVLCAAGCVMACGSDLFFQVDLEGAFGHESSVAIIKMFFS